MFQLLQQFVAVHGGYRDAFIGASVIDVKAAVELHGTAREYDVLHHADALSIVTRRDQRVGQARDHLTGIVTVQQRRAGMVYKAFRGILGGVVDEQTAVLGLNGWCAATDVAARRTIYGKIAAQEEADLPIMYLYSATNIVGMTRKLSGFQPVADGMIRLTGMKLAK